MADFLMPSLGADMEAGTLVEWLVKPGDRVERGAIVAVVETQKGAIEIEIFESGTIESISVAPGTEVPVGTPLATITTDSEAASRLAAAPSAATKVPVTTERPPTVPQPSPPSAPVPSATVSIADRDTMTTRRRISPAARRLAESRQVDVDTLTGSGPAGAIVMADVERHLTGAAARVSERRSRTTGLDLDAMRVAIAAAMSRSKREIPHYYLAHQVDVTRCVQWLAETNVARPPDRRLLLGAATVKAVALALRRHPAFNGFYRDGKFEPSEAIHAGIAIAIRGGGLAAPALHDTAARTLDQLMADMRDLVQRTRAGRMRSSEIADATVTVSSLGERGVEQLYGVIYPPQVAIVGIGKAVIRPWVIDGAIGPRTIVTVTLAADHRVSDGHAGASFLAEIGNLLQQPDKL